MDIIKILKCKIISFTKLIFKELRWNTLLTFHIYDTHLIVQFIVILIDF